MFSNNYYEALEAAKKHHASSKTYSGKLLRPHVFYIKELIERLQIGSILDYGCGKGAQYEWKMPSENGKNVEEYWGLDVTKYDPAWPAFATEPVGKFDLVICTHTLGSIPLSDRSSVIDKLYDFAWKGLYIAEKIGPIKKGVHSKNDNFPEWGREEWAAALRRKDQDVLCFLSTRERVDGEVITTREVL